MPLLIKEMHSPARSDALNEEWITIENTGPSEVHTAGLTLALVQQGKRPRALGTLSPGCTLRPGEQVRLITGSAAKQAQGTPPPESEGLRNYHLFLREPVLARPGEIQLLLKQFPLCRATIGVALPA